MSRFRPALTFLILMLAARPSWGDTLGPVLPSRTMEAGVVSRGIERTVSYVPYSGSTEVREMKLEQNDIALFARYGITSNATVSFELSVTPDELAFEDGDGSLYLVGSSLQLGIWSDAKHALSFGFHYASFFWRSEQPDSPDMREQLLEWTFLLQRAWHAGPAQGFVWAGPIASHLSLSQQQPFNDSYQEPNEMYGGLVGANARFIEHIGLETQFLYVETGELHVALFYRF